MDGLALLCACVKTWLHRDAGCPHVLVSTHFHSISQHGLLPESDQLTYQVRQVSRSQTDRQTDRQTDSIDSCPNLTNSPTR